MSPIKKKGLGRGLSALFGDQVKDEKSPIKSAINRVLISDLSRNPYQPRETFNEDKLIELSNSIKKKRNHPTYCSKTKKKKNLENMKL